jgi:hypothetical protein
MASRGATGRIGCRVNAKSITLPKSGNVSIEVSACGGFVLLLP